MCHRGDTNNAWTESRRTQPHLGTEGSWWFVPRDDWCWAETSVQGPVWVESGNCSKGGNRRHGITLMNLPKTEVIYKAAARNLNPRQKLKGKLCRIYPERRKDYWARRRFSWHQSYSEVESRDEPQILGHLLWFEAWTWLLFGCEHQ